jgi:glycogen phosphorylase
MKAALNGAPSLSVLDGWWDEGLVEYATGWAIGNDSTNPADGFSIGCQCLPVKQQK